MVDSRVLALPESLAIEKHSIKIKNVAPVAQNRNVVLPNSLKGVTDKYLKNSGGSAMYIIKKFNHANPSSGIRTILALI